MADSTMELVNSSLIITLILTAWFKTNAFCEYVQLLGFKNQFWVSDYFRERKKLSTSLHYTEYLLLKKNCFFVRLITCPICLGMWLTVLFGAITDFDNFFVKFYLASSLYYLYCILINHSYATPDN